MDLTIKILIFAGSMEKLASIKGLLVKPKRIVILTHFKPDADALGSSLGLAGFLKKTGHNAEVLTPSDFPDFLSWMPGADSVAVLDPNSRESEQKASLLIQTADIIFCLDFSSLGRINSLGEMVKTSQAIKIMIDHHLEPESFVDYQLWDVKAASTAQLVCEFIKSLGESDKIDHAIANCLYAGLMTDTGGFRHNNTTQKEFLIASELVSYGANPSEVARMIYDTNSVERLRLTGYVLNKKLVTLPDFRTAYMTITQDELKQFGAQTGDTEGLVNFGLSIKNIQMSALMYDRDDEIKLSFRSLENFSVNDLARKHFDGGGHRNASGGSSRLSLEATLEKFLSILPEYKDHLNQK